MEIDLVSGDYENSLTANTWNVKILDKTFS